MPVGDAARAPAFQNVEVVQALAHVFGEPEHEARELAFHRSASTALSRIKRRGSPTSTVKPCKREHSTRSPTERSQTSGPIATTCASTEGRSLKETRCTSPAFGGLVGNARSTT